MSNDVMRMLLTGICVLVIVGCADETKRPEVILERAYQAERAKDFPLAIALISEVIVSSPGDPVLYYDRGVFKEQSGDAQGAIEDYSTSLSIDESLFQARNNRAVLLINAGRYEEAARDLTRVIEEQPEDGWAHFNRGKLKLAQGQTEDAISDIESAIKRTPEVAVFHQFLGRALLEHGDAYRALEAATIAVHLAPEDKENRKLRAEVYDRLGQASLAERDRKAMGP